MSRLFYLRRNCICRINYLNKESDIITEMKESWHKKEIHKFITENKRELIVSIFVMLIAITWYFFTDNYFSIKKYEPVSEPILTLRMLSGLTFSSLGLFLYNTKVYQFLHWALDRKTFNELKKIIWLLLMFTVGFVILPFIIDVVNFILSFLFNILNFIIWFFPLVGIPLLIFLGLRFWNKIKK